MAFVPPEISDPSARAGLAWAPLALILVASLATTILVGGRPRDGARLAAVFPPWWTAERSLAAAAAAGPVVGFGAVPFIVAVADDDPRLIERLEAAGAWLVLDGSRFRLCSYR